MLIALDFVAVYMIAGVMTFFLSMLLIEMFTDLVNSFSSSVIKTVSLFSHVFFTLSVVGTTNTAYNFSKRLNLYYRTSPYFELFNKSYNILCDKDL